MTDMGHPYLVQGSNFKVACIWLKPVPIHVYYTNHMEPEKYSFPYTSDVQFSNGQKGQMSNPKTIFSSTGVTK